ncbi:hypothetical protein P154DRAFT_154633 [Amniculicola lignicola CBS 123094]|uniref:Velvet domain-containing protein n=1 Tax=Amniculicola lignicola CBS 123094 TaxID=1392246 RepID=A0A6A5WJ53_9PLEO|nr:hypothetical protein P154DRAFT_154633 [Amniculicola lignicola CBS 123094]
MYGYAHPAQGLYQAPVVPTSAVPSAPAVLRRYERNPAAVPRAVSAPVKTATNHTPLREDIDLEIRQQPKECLVTTDGKEKARKPVDPPPIVQLTVKQHIDPAQHFLQSPYLFMCVSLHKADKDEPWDGLHASRALVGALTSSLHRLKDVDNKDGAFFVFGDISVRVQGIFRLRFSLFDLRKEAQSAEFLGSITSEPFRVLLAKDFKGMEESTYLSRAFSDQGVRLRLRKEPRAMMGTKRSYPFPVDTSANTPLRPNMSDYGYDDQASPVKRLRTDSGDRKEQYHDQSVVTSAAYPTVYTSSYTPQLRQPSVSGMQSMAHYPTYAASSSSPYASQHRSSIGSTNNFFNPESMLPSSTPGAMGGHMAHQQRFPDLNQHYSQMFSYPSQDTTGLSMYRPSTSYPLGDDHRPATAQGMTHQHSQAQDSSIRTNESMQTTRGASHSSHSPELTRAAGYSERMNLGSSSLLPAPHRSSGSSRYEDTSQQIAADIYSPSRNAHPVLSIESSLTSHADTGAVDPALHYDPDLGQSTEGQNVDHQ